METRREQTLQQILSSPPNVTEFSAKSVTFQSAQAIPQVRWELHERPMTEGHEPLPEKWRRFRQRPPEDRVLILRAALILPLTEIGLRLFGFRRWKGLLREIFPARAPSCIFAG